MTVRLIVYMVKNNRTSFLGCEAVIFASWNHAFNARNQDYKKSHTVRSLFKIYVLL